MARIKNALTQYFIGEITGEKEVADYAALATLELAKWITNVSDGSEDKTEDYADYAGDGSETTDVTGRSEKYDLEGTYDATDPAQKFVNGIKRDVNLRKVAFKIVNPDGTIVSGPATVSDIVAGEGGGDAQEYSDFKATISFDRTPDVKPSVA